MSDFFENEAEVGTTEESDVSMSDEGEIGHKRKKIKKEKKKKKAKRMVDSSDEDEEGGEDLDGDLEDLIDDNPVEDEDGDDGGGKDSEESELDDELEEDEIDLLEENLGIKIDRSKKRKRVRTQISSDEESEQEAVEGEDRDKIAREIFLDDDDLPPSEREAAHEQEEEVDQVTQDLENLDEQEEEEESDYDDFIVDDEGQPISKVKKKKKLVHNDAQLQEAQDIFGVDYDFDEFDQYDEAYEEDDDEEDEYEDDEEEARPKPKKAMKRKKAKSIYQMIEPSELERGFHTDGDQEIRTADMPERFQLRGIPVCPTEDGELQEEAAWIHKCAFGTLPLSQQEFSEQDGERSAYRDSRFQSTKGTGCIEKIKKALNFMRNQQFEVPFIAFYRKEYVETELNINDLWKVYQWDEKWMQLRSRKQNLLRLFEKMQVYQFDQIDPDKPLDSHIRTLTEDDIIRAKNVQNMEELRDVYQHFVLYYGPDIPKMKAALKVKKRQEREAARTEDGEAPPDDDNDDDDHETLKQAFKKTGYTMCIQAGLAELARKFGLSPENFAENLRDNYGRNDIEQDPAHPQELAQEFVCEQFSTPDDVLKGARHVVAMQLSHEPLVRECVRTAVHDRAKITLTPTKKGLKEIDEGHVCFTFRYVIDKPVRELSNDQFLKITQAEEDGLMTSELHVDMKATKGMQTYFEEIKSLYTLDEFSNLVQDWNSEREQALERALNLMLFPQLLKELRAKLIEEAKEHVTRSCASRLYGWLKVAPYQIDQQLDDDDDDYDISKGLKVMAISFSGNRDEAAFGVIIDGDGEVTDYMRLKSITNRKDSWRKEDRDAKAADLEKMKNFILNKKPHVIGLLATSRDAMMVQEDIVGVVTELEQEHQMAPINVELVDSELAVVFSNSKKAETDFRDYPEVLRQAISIARRLQDPLVEFCQLCNPDEDIMALKYHPLQNAVSQEVLLNALHLEFINRVNEVGVDVDACVNHPHKAPLIQFVCGLGPRKGFHLLKILRQKNTRLENRTQLVTMCRMGPKVFINCAGFIKIDTSALGDGTEAYVEVLDGSRVHPETYDWARKMAVDALEYDDTAEDANPAGALEEILESPDRLRDLDLDAFAVELEKQGYGNRQITLYDIRAELNHRYRDLRVMYRPPTAEERFNMLTKECPQMFHIGKLIMCVVTGIAHKRPKGDQLDQANPVRNDETGLWRCPFCQKDDFPELSEVWNHFDAGECRGQAVGVKTRMDNGISGFIPLKNLSDKHVQNPEDRVQVGMTMHCRITKIDIDKFQVELTSKSSDLADKEGKWKLQRDPYYDYEHEEVDIKKEQEKKQKQARQTYVKRVIAHPSFHNIDYKATEKLMVNMEQGDVIIRPSSKGTDRLTVTWKVAESILQHLDIREEGKENAFSLGSSLWIGNEEFEDLDEIIARHIQPMAAFARDILNYKYYKDSDGGNREIMDRICTEEKRKGPSKIPYFLTASKQFPGKFMISYCPRKNIRHEFVTVTPDGFRYRQQMFTSLNSLVRWFKEHFRDAIPGTPASIQTPLGAAGVGATPNINLHNVDVATIQRAAAGLSSGVFNTLAQVAGQTPFSGFNQFQQQTPMMTPMMTPAQRQQPFMTPVGMGTPIATPSQNISGYSNRANNWPGGTPRVHSGNTPRQYPGTTPRPGQMTPRPGQMTPRPGQMTPRPGQMTPRPGQATPRHYPGAASPRPGSVTPRMYPGETTPQHRSGGAPGSRTPRQTRTGPPNVASNSSQDWAKMAEMWAKQRLSDQGPDYDGSGGGRSRRTPRSEQSPRTPKGDATPLFDER